MALKDITLGQYFPGNSLVHRLDPRTKLLAVTLYIDVYKRQCTPASVRPAPVHFTGWHTTVDLSLIHI